ncbi:Lipid transfer-like protein VAS [Abeliophyllum distichum]|uniref:Lipid transfer-like protein VAS n=1 Tax=Abeliophyllum distichum TaxID=126358 RepID=A0ABD1UMI2_9LAMI
MEFRAVCRFSMAMIIFSCLVSQNRGQVQQQECMNQLQPCLNYLNGNQNPPDSCCNPLRHVIKSMPECLCSLITIKGANQAERAGINVTEAQTLPGRCGEHINPLGCITGTPDTRSRNSVQNSSSSSFGLSGLIIVVAVSIGILVLNPL